MYIEFSQDDKPLSPGLNPLQAIIIFHSLIIYALLVHNRVS